MDHKNEITEVVSGACPTGADFDGERWAKAKNIPVKRFPANWHAHGNKAGPIRNKQMAEYARGGRCIVFPGGRGTDSMFREATLAGLEILDLRKGLDAHLAAIDPDGAAENR